jgi:hypothetical protein
MAERRPSLPRLTRATATPPADARAQAWRPSCTTATLCVRVFLVGMGDGEGAALPRLRDGARAGPRLEAHPSPPAAATSRRRRTPPPLPTARRAARVRTGTAATPTAPATRPTPTRSTRWTWTPPTGWTRCWPWAPRPPCSPPSTAAASWRGCVRAGEHGHLCAARRGVVGRGGRGGDLGGGEPAPPSGRLHRPVSPRL